MFERKNPVPRESQRRRAQLRSYEDQRNKEDAKYSRRSYFSTQPLSYLKDAFTGKLVTPEELALKRREALERSFEESLEVAKEQARTSMLEETDAYRAYELMHEEGLEPQSMGVWLEKAIRTGRMPKAIVSEDVTGRVVANILSDVLTRIEQRIHGDSATNVPVISYASGRYTPEDKKRQFAQAVAAKLEKYAGQQVLICTDAVESGSSMAPLLKEIGGGKFPLAFLIDRITPRAETMIAAHTKQTTIERISLHPALELGQGHIMRPMERWYDPKTRTKSLLLVVEEPENRVLRLRAEKEIADVLYEAFLTRPGVQELLSGQNERGG